MIIYNGKRYTKVLVILNNIMGRIGLCVLSYANGDVFIDTHSVMVRINSYSISSVQKTTNINNMNIYISQPLYNFLSRMYGYTHSKFRELTVDKWEPHMLFVGVAGCELLPPMRYITSCRDLFMSNCKVDYCGVLPTGLILL